MTTKPNNPFVRATCWCDNCKAKVPITAGSYVPLPDGKHQRWICFKCQNRMDAPAVMRRRRS